VVGDDEPSQTSATTITIADLTADGFRTYQLERTIYQDDKKDYTQQVEAVKQLKQWILKTVSLHFQLTACDPLHSITQWYTALKQQAGISDDEAVRRARDTYRLAITPLQRTPKDLIQWSESWEHAISAAQRKGVAEALTTKTWLFDFMDAVKPILGHWVTSYKLLKASQLTLSYQEVANDFREEVRQARKAKTASVRGAFGPSFADAHQEDALDDDVEPGSDEGERNTGRKRKWDDSPSGRTAKRVECICPVCGLFHRLLRCYYIFPEKAPKGFEERDHIRAKVKKALEDPKLWKKVERLQKS